MAITANPINQNGALITAQGTKTFLNIAANTLVKTGTGRVAKISVIATSSTAGSLHDSATIAGAATSNALAIIPATVGVYNIDIPAFNGIVLKPGTGQTVVISYI